MNAPASITITPVRVADLLAEGERMPVYVHVIDHPDARVLVDTGMTELHPAVADLDPRLRPLSKQDFDLAGIDIVVNTHLHFDHCGGNHLFAGRPIYVQRRELDDARSEDDYTIRVHSCAKGGVTPCAATSWQRPRLTFGCGCDSPRDTGARLGRPQEACRNARVTATVCSEAGFC